MDCLEEITHLYHSHVAIAWNLLQVHFLVQGNPRMPVAIATQSKIYMYGLVSRRKFYGRGILWWLC